MGSALHSGLLPGLRYLFKVAFFCLNASSDRESSSFPEEIEKTFHILYLFPQS